MSNEEPFLKRPLGRVLIHVLIAIVFTGLVILSERLNVPHEIELKVMLYLTYFLAAETIVYFGRKVAETNKNLDLTRAEIAKQNASANEELIRIATKDIEEKIFRKLVSTNAVIPDRDHKVSITARVLEDFHDKQEYEDKSFKKQNTESIDLVRVLSYQNLLLTPKYLEYFYYRKDSVKKATRIIVLDREQINTTICQATLTYVFMSAKSGYYTYILTEKRFRLLTQQPWFTEENRKIIKGNPFMLKISDGNGETYRGYYTDYRENIEDNGSKKLISGIGAWQLLERFKENSASITPETEFANYLRGRITTLNQTAITYKQ
jgi:hypothetical protein